MPFCWMDENSEAAGAGKQVESVIAEIQDKAGLLRRLGYSKADTIHRCLGNVAWAHSHAGKPAVSPSQIRKIIGEIYSGE